ncbi:hypothetical protein TcCL_Unassigned01819 [Trypanosoma cruzi]|nr:hypothetical protein TcCL_Unassigned01819 [Trypanosoma cruzi]
MRGARQEATHTQSPTHILSHNFPTHKRAKKWRGKARRTTHAEAPPSKSRRKIESCAQQTHGRNERDGAHTSPRRCPLLLSAPTDRHYASQQVVASGAIHSQ